SSNCQPFDSAREGTDELYPAPATVAHCGLHAGGDTGCNIADGNNTGLAGDYYRAVAAQLESGLCPRAAEVGGGSCLTRNWVVFWKCRSPVRIVRNTQNGRSLSL